MRDARGAGTGIVDNLFVRADASIAAVGHARGHAFDGALDDPALAQRGARHLALDHAVFLDVA